MRRRVLLGVSALALAIKTGDGNVTNSSGYVQNAKRPLSGKFNSVSSSCQN